MSTGPLSVPVTAYDDIERLLLSRVREDPRPYDVRAAIAGKAVGALLERAGRPQDRLRFLHIAGSKGKGSVALLSECLLRSQGLRVGTYTSPHLRRWNERVRVDGKPVSDALLADALETLRPLVAALDATGDALSASFFDLMTAAALVVFARTGCEAVVLETGLGGTYDATNVVAPVACCITSIELEHTDKLGPTLADVARHKAGIVKPGVPVVTGDLPAQAREVVAAAAAAAGCVEIRLGRDFDVQSHALSVGAREVTFRSRRCSATTFTLNHPAPHMAVNAGLALALTLAAGFTPDASALAACALPARAQLLRERPWILIDGAHTRASLEALRETLAAIPSTARRFVVSATRGKSIDALAQLLEGCEEVTATCADPLRSAPAAEIARQLALRLPGTRVRTIEAPVEALLVARDGLEPDAVLCVCGSVYLAGAALDAFERESR